MKVFKPKAISKCPDCGWSSKSYTDFLEHRVKCLRAKTTPELDAYMASTLHKECYAGGGQ